MERIARIVAEFYGISYPKMFTRTRKGSYPYARQVTMYIARVLHNVTHEEAAGFFGRDHATSVHAVGVVENHIKYNSERKRDYKKLILRVKIDQEEASYIKLNNRLTEVCKPIPYEYKESKQGPGSN